MTVGIMVVTHEGLGAQLIAVSATILKPTAKPIALVSIPSDLEPDALGQYADLVRNTMQDQNSGQGVLVLTDLCGATPDNLARHFGRECNARVVSGINLPMLLRVLNYAQQPLEQLCETASTGGKSGVYQGQE